MGSVDDAAAERAKRDDAQTCMDELHQRILVEFDAANRSSSCWYGMNLARSAWQEVGGMQPTTAEIVAAALILLSKVTVNRLSPKPGETPCDYVHRAYGAL